MILKIGTLSNVADGIEIPCTKLKITAAHLSINSERTADGLLHRNVVAMKTNVDFSTKPMYNNKMKSILTILNKSDFYAQFFDPNTGSMQIKHVYCGDRAVDVIRYEGDTKVLYGECSFSLVEI